MRQARKLFLVAVTTVAALAMTAGSSNAAVQIFDEPGDQCSNVSLSGHTVTGGCHVEFKSTGDIPLVAYIPAPTTLSNCQIHLEGQIGGNGAGYITSAALTAPSGGPVPCTRTQCEEADGTKTPWPFEINESAGQTSIEIRFCLRFLTMTLPLFTVHISIHSEGGHNHEFGVTGVEAFAEAGDWPFPVSLQNAHFINEVPAASGTEDVEIIH